MDPTRPVLRCSLPGRLLCPPAGTGLRCALTAGYVAGASGRGAGFRKAVDRREVTYRFLACAEPEVIRAIMVEDSL